jgi:hypothetical protein
MADRQAHWLPGRHPPGLQAPQRHRPR